MLLYTWKKAGEKGRLILSSDTKYNQINFSKNHVCGNARKIGVTVIWWFTVETIWSLCLGNNIGHIMTMTEKEFIILSANKEMFAKYGIEVTDGTDYTDMVAALTSSTSNATRQ